MDSGVKESDALMFYLHGKLASELPSPEEDLQSSAALYRAVCDANLAVVKSLLENGHDPNVPYYYIHKKGKTLLCSDHDLSESDEDNRGMFHHPLHRAVLLNNLELVALLLDHGADPNAVDGRSNTPLAMLIESNNFIDNPVVEKLIVEGADKEAALYQACNGKSFLSRSAFVNGIKWPVVATLLRQGADLREVMRRSDRCFLNVINLCGHNSQHMATAYEILGAFLDIELDERLLKWALERTLFSMVHVDMVRKLALLIEIGVPVDYTIDRLEGRTNLQLRFARIETKLSKCPEHFSYTVCIDFSCVWILVKASAQLVWYEGGNMIDSARLKHLEERLNTAYDTTEASSDCRRSSILGHLQHCKDIMTWLHGTARSPSLFHLSVLAVRRSLGLYPGRKLRTMDIPQRLHDAVLLKDLWPFVENTEQRLSPTQSTRSEKDVSLHV